MRERNNEELMKEDENYGILFFGVGLTIKSRGVFNATVHYFHHYVTMHEKLYLTDQMVSCNNKFATFFSPE